MKIYIIGYVPKYFWRKKHTTFWPFRYFAETFRDLGYDAHHVNVDKIDFSEPAVFICWYQPTSVELIERFQPHKDSIIVQQLTHFGSISDKAGTSWTADPKSFFKEWHWPLYQNLDVLEESGYAYWGFGARTDVDSFPTKRAICERHRSRICWIPWGSVIVPYDEIQRAEPVMRGFEYDLGYVGSRWGTEYRGNLLEWDNYLQPLIDRSETPMVAGRGTRRGAVSVREHIDILRRSRLCPVIHDASWKAQRGVMDRFWTVFSVGRFGVVDNEGVLEFYDEKDVVLATDREEYLDKSLFFMKSPERQRPFIEAALKRIKTEYNQRVVWRDALGKMLA